MHAAACSVVPEVASTTHMFIHMLHWRLLKAAIAETYTLLIAVQSRDWESMGVCDLMTVGGLLHQTCLGFALLLRMSSPQLPLYC